MKKFEIQVASNLEDLKNNVDRNYEIVAEITEFPSVVAMGKTYTERLQLLVMCYYVNPTLKELKTVTLEKVLQYIEDTDEMWKNDKRYFIKCKNLILELADQQVQKQQIETTDNILRDIDKILDKTNGIALSLLLVEEDLEKIGMLDNETKNNIEKIRNRLMGAYNISQYFNKNIRNL